VRLQERQRGPSRAAITGNNNNFLMLIFNTQKVFLKINIRFFRIVHG
jgi:hypothetical protein